MRTNRFFRKKLLIIPSLLLLLISTSIGSELSHEAPSPEERPSCDLLFINGKIMDGSGNPWVYGDVAVKSGRIISIGKLEGKIEAGRTIDILGKIPDNCITQKIDGAILHAPNGNTVEIDYGKEGGYVVERKMFDKWLAYRASRAGATVIAHSEVTDVLKDGNQVVGVRRVERTTAAV